VANRVIEQLDEKIRQLEARLAGLRAFRAMVAEDPAFVIELQDLLLNPEANGVLHTERATAAREPGLPKYERIKEFLLSKGNEWMSIRQIAAGTQISRNTVADILYHSHAHIFEGKRTSKNRKWWRVKVAGGEPVASHVEEEPEPPPKATVPFGIGDKATERPTRTEGPRRPKPKWPRS
jgi:hypothetical protein